MSEEGKLYEDISRAHQVNALLENGVLNRAMDDMKAQLIELWMNTNVKDVAGRERMHLEINILDKLKAHLRIVLDNGKLAQADLNARNKRVAA